MLCNIWCRAIFKSFINPQPTGNLSQGHGLLRLKNILCLFCFPDVGWLKRRTANLARPCVVVTEGAQGIINLKTSGPGVKQTSAEKTITLGEEHTEILPNGLETKVMDATALDNLVNYYYALHI